MKRVTVLCVLGQDDLCWELYEKYKDKIPKEYQKISNYKGGQLNLRLLAGSPELKEAIQFAEKKDMNLHFFSEMFFTAKETREAPFFCARVAASYELQGGFLDKCGTKFAGGCPRCGYGRKPDGSVLANISLLKNHQLGWMEPIYYVSDRVRILLEESDLTGFRIRQQIKDYRGREMPPYYVLEIESVLPPLSESTWFEGNRLSRCMHPRPLYVRSDLQYEKEKLIDAKDFNCTQEELNNFNERALILSAKARRFFRENKIYASFVPLTIL